MNRRHAPSVVVVGLGAALVALLAWLFDQRLRQGDVFPAYSSLRSDPLGTRVFHDALASLPGMRVDRFDEPLDRLPLHPPRTILLAGLRLSRWRQANVAEAAALDAAARAGSRVVIVFAADFVPEPGAAGPDEAPAEPKKESAAPTPHPETSPPRDENPDIFKPPPPADWRQLWGVAVERHWMFSSHPSAEREAAAAASLPEAVPWQSELCFKVESRDGWRTVYGRGGRPVVVERPCGAGSIVLAADAYFLSNEAMQNARAVPLLTWLVGSGRRVQFVESHLGVIDRSGVAALARRYGLGAAAGVGLLLAGLFVWRQTALFLPPAPRAPDEIAVATDSAAGLTVLLRRALPDRDLVGACVEEWRRCAPAHRSSPSAPARLEKAWRTGPPRSDPVAAYNHIVRELQRRG